MFHKFAQKTFLTHLKQNKLLLWNYKNKQFILKPKTNTPYGQRHLKYIATKYTHTLPDKTKTIIEKY